MGLFGANVHIDNVENLVFRYGDVRVLYTARDWMLYTSPEPSEMGFLWTVFFFGLGCLYGLTSGLVRNREAPTR